MDLEISVNPLNSSLINYHKAFKFKIIISQAKVFSIFHSESLNYRAFPSKHRRLEPSAFASVRCLGLTIPFEPAQSLSSVLTFSSVD